MKALASLALSVFLAAAVESAGASDFSERGVKLFMENKPQEAAPVLELASKEAGAAELTFLYLGISYQQLGRWDEAIAAFRRGLQVAKEHKHLFLFNIANSFFSQGRASFAIESYDQTLAVRSDFAPAYLNRANARMRTGDIQAAVADYSVYITLDPDSPQAPSIRQLLDLLAQKTAEAERLKALDEAKRLAEEAARKALQDAVAQSLREAAEDTTSLSAGSGDLQGYEDDISLDD